MGFDISAAKNLAQNEWENLISQIEQCRPEILILSSEVQFGAATDKEIEKARNYLPTLTDDIEVFAYIRSPIKQYLSLVQQVLKTVSDIRQPIGSNITSVLDTYQKIYDQPVRTRIFGPSALLDNDVVSDFLDWANIPVPAEDVPSIRSNDSVSAECMSILHEVMPKNRPTNQQELVQVRKLRRAIILADKSVQGATKPALKPQITESLTAQCTDLIRLRDDFGIEFSDIDYELIKENAPAPFEVSQIEQLCYYDADRKENVFRLAQENLEKKRSKNKSKNKKRRSPPASRAQKLKSYFKSLLGKH